MAHFLFFSAKDLPPAGDVSYEEQKYTGKKSPISSREWKQDTILCSCLKIKCTEGMFPECSNTP